MHILYKTAETSIEKQSIKVGTGKITGSQIIRRDYICELIN